MKTLITLILCLSIACPVYSADKMLERSKQFTPMVKEVVDAKWPTAPMREFMCGQIEQESMWKPTAKLETSRELGRGFAQITIAYDKAGKERFNNFRNAIHIKGLEDWDWKNDPYNTQYQTTYLVLTDRSNYATVRKHMLNDYGGVVSALICYNAGYGRWLQRRAVAKAKGYPANIWHGGLDKSYTNGEATTIIYNKPLWKMVNEYPEYVLKKSKKYKGILDR